MTITIAEQLKVPFEFVANTTEYANLTAGWAFLTMLEWGWSSGQMSSRHPALILEIGALRHVAWLNQCADDAGLSLPDLPKHHEEEANLLARMKNDPESFSTIDGATLSRRVFEFQMKNVAWASPTDGTATLSHLYLIQDDVPEYLDGLLDQLAQALCKTIS